MKTYKFNVYFFVSLFLLFTACKSKDDSESLIIPESFRFMWEYEDNEANDEYFLQFKEQEVVLYSRFEEDCYRVYTDILIERDDDKFTFQETDFEDKSTYLAYIKIEEGDLWVSSVRTYETKDIHFKSERIASSFEPKCSDASSKAIQPLERRHYEF